VALCITLRTDAYHVHAPCQMRRAQGVGRWPRGGLPGFTRFWMSVDSIGEPCRW